MRNMRRDMARDCDHPLAFGHDGIIAFFEPVGGIIGTMEGGHKWYI